MVGKMCKSELTLKVAQWGGVHTPLPTLVTYGRGCVAVNLACRFCSLCDASLWNMIGVEEFQVACAVGDGGVVAAGLAQGGAARLDVNADGGAALCGACRGGHLGVVRLLLEAGGGGRVNVHVAHERPLRLACWAGHVPVLQALLALEGDRAVNVHVGNEAPLHAAVDRGHNDVIALLLGLPGDRRPDVCSRGGRAHRVARSQNNVDMLVALACGAPSAV